jgi:hypothetical protein
MQDGQATVTITVDDDYTNEPVESVLVRLLDNGNEIASGTTDLTGRADLVLSVTSTEEPSDLIPETFQVSESYPNPFEQSSSVNLEIEKAQEVQAEIYNIIGQRVASLQVKLTPGTYTLQSSLGHLAQGVYFLRILGTQSKTIKMTKVGERIFSGGSILNINPATFVTRNGPGVAGLVLDEHTGRSLTLVASNSSYDTYQQSIQIASDTTVTVEMSRNNEVIVRVADENSPSEDVETSLLIEGDQFSQQITSPDTLTLKSGFYTLSADEGNTAAFSQDVEIASEDQTVTVLTQVKTLADDQLQIEGMITDEASGNPIDRAYIYLLNQTTSDTLAGPLFAGSDGVLDAIANLDNGPNLDLSILYRKAGYTDFESTASVSLPDTLTLNTTLQPAPAPTASFTVLGDQTVGQPVIFDATSSTGASGEELTYSWDFGNGKSGGGPTIGYVYSNSGSYDVILNVVGDFGADDQVTQSISIAAVQAAGTASLSGTIFTNEGEELEGVLVTTADGSVTGVSNPEGDVTLEGLDTGVPIVLTLTREGYSNQYVRIEIPAETNTAVFEANMLPRAAPMVADQIEAGGQFEGMDGAKVTLPIDGFINEAGETVTGDVEMTFTPLDVRNDGNLRSFPGSFSAVTSNGDQGELVTFGLAEYNFEQDGESVQLAPGKKATIEIPYYLDTNTEGNPVQAGDMVPLWSLDESSGLWVEEGTGSVVASAGSPTGYALRADVMHFSWWNIDAINERYTAIAECKIIDNNGLPTLDIPDGGACFIRGVTGSGCTGRSIATTQIPSGTSIEIPLSSDCNTTLFASSPNGESGNSTISGTPGSTINVTIELSSQLNNNGQTLTVNDVETNELDQNTVTYQLDPENNEFIILELEKMGNGRPIASIKLFDPDNNLIDSIEMTNGDSFSAYKERILFEVQNSGLHRIEIEHTEGNELFYTLRVQPLEELTLESELDFSVIRGISRYLYIVPDADYIVRSDDGGTLFNRHFSELGNFLTTGDSGGPLNLFSLRQDSVYVIEHLNQDGPEVIQKQFLLEGQLRENLILEPENVLTLDLIQSGESFLFDTENSENVVVEIDKSPGENVSATLNLIDPSGNILDSDLLEDGAISNTYRAQVFSNVTSNGLYSIEIVPNNSSSGNYSIRTYSPDEVLLDEEYNFTVPNGGSYYHIFKPNRDMAVRANTGIEMLDTSFNSLGGLFLRGEAVGLRLSADSQYLIFNEGFFPGNTTGDYQRSFIMSEVLRQEVDFDGGQYITSNIFSAPNQAHVYTFDAVPNSGVVAFIERVQSQLGVTSYVGRVGNGTYYDLDALVTNSSSNPISTIIESNFSDTYAIVVISGQATGTYNIQIDFAEPAESYVISQDLSCPGSTLRSIHAVALAAPENSTISLCEGANEILVPVEMVNSNVSMTGTDKNNSILRSSLQNFMSVSGDNIQMNNLSIETNAQGRFSSGVAVRIEGDNFQASDLIVRPIENLGGYDTGFEINGDNSVIEQSEFINTGEGTAIELSGVLSVLIDSNEFLNHGFAIRSRSLSGDITISNNNFIYNSGSAIPAAIELEPSTFDTDGITNRVIEYNTINFENESGQIITANQRPEQPTNDIIRGNTINWFPRSATSIAIDADVGFETSSVLIEQNEVTTSNTSGGIGVRVAPKSTLLDSGPIYVRNNVIKDTYRGIEVLFPDLFTSPVKIFNNSIRTTLPRFNDPMVGLRIAGSSQSESGTVLVEYVNNIFQGRSGRNDIGVDIYSEFQMDSDYNLFHNVSSNYSGGSTTTGANDLSGDPLFINDLLELGASSPAVDSGATFSEYDGIPDADINGITRPQGSGIDRGAVESNN